MRGRILRLRPRSIRRKVLHCTGIIVSESEKEEAVDAAQLQTGWIGRQRQEEEVLGKALAGAVALARRQASIDQEMSLREIEGTSSN